MSDIIITLIMTMVKLGCVIIFIYTSLDIYTGIYIRAYIWIYIYLYIYSINICVCVCVCAVVDEFENPKNN